MAAKSAVSSLLLRLEKWLASKRPRFYRGLLPGASTAELNQLEKDLGRKVPRSLKTLLAWHNGQNPDCPGGFIEDWRLLSTSRIAALKAELDADAEATGWHSEWIPFLEDDQGNAVCLEKFAQGEIVREFWGGERAHLIVDKSLTAWLEDFVTTVEAEGYYEDPERGTFMRTTRS